MSAEDLPYHYRLLGVKTTATLAEIKKAYYRLAHRFHPDKATPQTLQQNTEIMIRLNEAYRRAIRDAEIRSREPAQKSPQTEISPGQASAPVAAPPPPKEEPKPVRETAPALPRDPAYSLYKQGHIFFHRGFYKFYRKKTVIQNKLQAALEIINNFQKAYDYYIRVVEEYPDSPWCSDARLKIAQIRKLTPIYHNILKRLREINDEELRKMKIWEEISRRNGFCTVKDLERNFLHIWEVNKV